MKPSLETNFKNMNLNLVVAFGRTGGVHHPVLPQMRRTRNQIELIRGLFDDSLHPIAPLHSLIIPRAPEHLGSNPSRRFVHRQPGGRSSCRHAVVSSL